MQSLMTLLGCASLGAGAMYLMDPDRGHRRRAELRETLTEVADSELVERARQLEPLAAVRQLGGGVGALLEGARWVPAARLRGWCICRFLGCSARCSPSWGCRLPARR